MSEVIIGVLSTAFLCGVGGLLSKLCTIRAKATNYILITQDHYDSLPIDVKQLILHQPQLPKYSESH
jgi:hypothetical protein